MQLTFDGTMQGVIRLAAHADRECRDYIDAYNARFDPQAKALGEQLRSRFADIPESLL